MTQIVLKTSVGVHLTLLCIKILYMYVLSLSYTYLSLHDATMYWECCCRTQLVVGEAVVVAFSVGSPNRAAIDARRLATRRAFEQVMTNVTVLTGLFHVSLLLLCV